MSLYAVDGETETDPDAPPPGLDHRWLLIIPASYLLLLVMAGGLRKPLTWAMNATVLGLALLVIADASSFWSANNPSFMTERTFTTTGGKKAADTTMDIQIGGVKAIIESALVGIGASLVVGSFWPWAAQGIYMVSNWPYHQWGLTHPHGDTDIANQAG
jgi:hypothetical protein